MGQVDVEKDAPSSNSPTTAPAAVSRDNDFQSITPASSLAAIAEEEKDANAIISGTTLGNNGLSTDTSAEAETPGQGVYGPGAAHETAVRVSRSKRRGLFGQLTLLAEVEDPKTYPRRTKWFITFIVAVAGAVAPMGSSIFFREYLTTGS